MRQDSKIMIRCWLVDYLTSSPDGPNQDHGHKDDEKSFGTEWPTNETSNIE